MTFSRRKVLRGFGTLLALPFLESLEARGQTAPVKKRFLAYMVPNGVSLPKWNGAADPSARATVTALAQSGAVNELGPALHAYTTMINGLSIKHNIQPTGGHHRGVSGFLTSATCIGDALKLCINPPATGYANCTPAGISLDQILAQQLPRTTRYRSLEFGPYYPSDPTDNACGIMACAYLFNVSWLNGTTPAARERNPLRAFDRIFAGASATDSEAARQKRIARRLRVVDFVKDDAASLKTKLGRDDKRRVDQYFSAIADLEDDIRSAPVPASCGVFARPADPGNAFVDPNAYLETFRRIMVLALQCDLSRVITFMASYSGEPGYRHPRAYAGTGPGPNGSWDYSNGAPSGINLESHHPLSHWRASTGNNAPTLAEFQQYKNHGLAMIDRYYMRGLKELMDAMRLVDDGDGKTLLDNTLLYYGSDMSDGDLHSTENLPLLLAGGASGALQGNRVLNLNDTAANLHIAIAQTFGVNLSTFGNDGTRPLAGVFS